MKEFLKTMGLISEIIKLTVIYLFFWPVVLALYFMNYADTATNSTESNGAMFMSIVMCDVQVVCSFAIFYLIILCALVY